MKQSVNKCRWSTFWHICSTKLYNIVYLSLWCRERYAHIHHSSVRHILQCISHCSLFHYQPHVCRKSYHTNIHCHSGLQHIWYGEDEIQHCATHHTGAINRPYSKWQMSAEQRDLLPTQYLLRVIIHCPFWTFGFITWVLTHALPHKPWHKIKCSSTINGLTTHCTFLIWWFETIEKSMAAQNTTSPYWDQVSPSNTNCDCDCDFAWHSRCYATSTNSFLDIQASKCNTALPIHMQ